MTEITQRLDLLSTLHTKPAKCPFGAPLLAIVFEGKGRIIQTCCNHWECPICGDTRARQEYHRIVYGAQTLALQHQLYFVTVTCRGRKIPLREAEERYYEWTDRLLKAYRAHVQRSGGHWAYVQITERQKKTRAHPHSHILIAAIPSDAISTGTRKGRRRMVSPLFAKWNESAGLGSQHDITQVESADAVSRYIAKYLFKDTARDKFPPKWKRVRYSRSYPKPPERKPDASYPLEDAFDWQRIADMPIKWSTRLGGVAAWYGARYGDIQYEAGLT